MKHKIAVIDDDPQILSMVEQSLRSLGYWVESAKEGKEAIRLLTENRHDLIILDWNLPGADGLEIARLLRARPQTAQVPILMLTVMDDLKLKVSAFEAGADDYLTKPFEIMELNVRVKALLRRSAIQSPVKEILKVGTIHMNVDNHEVRVGKKQVQLRPKEFELLNILLNSDDRVVTRQNLIERVWGYNLKYISTRTVDSHVARLREKLGPEAARMIITIPGFGYKIEEKKERERRKTKT